jgi:hypothetical protein
MNAANVGTEPPLNRGGSVGPFVVLLGEHVADEADGRAAVGEGGPHVGPAADLTVEAFVGVGGPVLTSHLPREGSEGEDLVAGGVEVGVDLGQLLLD